MSHPTNRACLSLDTLDERVVMSATLPTLGALEPAVLVGGDGLKAAPTPATPTDSGATKGGTATPATPIDTGVTKGNIPATPTDSGATKGGTVATPTDTGATKGGTAATPNDSGATKGGTVATPTDTGATKGNTTPTVPTDTGATKGDPLVNNTKVTLGFAQIGNPLGKHALNISAQLTDTSGHPISRPGVYTVYLNGVAKGEFTTNTGTLSGSFVVPYGAYTVTVTFAPPPGMKGQLVSTVARYSYLAPTTTTGPSKVAVFGYDADAMFAPIVVG